MNHKKIEQMAAIIIIAMVFYSIVAIASIGRFSQTHAIVMKADCTDCHIDSLSNLDKGKHIGAMGRDQNKTIDNFFILRNSADVQGLCYSCHVAGARTNAFALNDFYIDSENNTVINGIDFWNNNINDISNIGNKVNGTETERIKVNITLTSISPENATLTLDATVQLMNFSGQQNSSKLFTNVYTTMYQNDSAIITRDNIYGDYFRIYITASGNWENARLQIGIDEPPSYPTLSNYLVNGSASDPGSNSYVLPNDFPLQYSNLIYFHTQGNYLKTQMSEALNFIRTNEINVSSIQTGELMNDTVRDTTKYSCGSAGGMCHINQRITDLGERFGINGERFYTHDLAYPDSNTCAMCHI